MKSTEDNKQSAQSKDFVFQSKEQLSQKANSINVFTKSQSFVKVLREKWIKLNQIKFKDVQRIAKETRKFLKLTKSPKRKGYDKFLTDDEKR